MYKKAAERKGDALDKKQAEQMHREIWQRYEQQMDIRYGAARGWVDAIIAPHDTRDVVANLLKLALRVPCEACTFHTGVIQV